MTVIVWREGTLASDTGIWRGRVLVGENREKIRRVGQFLVGGAGFSSDQELFRDWVANGRNPDVKPALHKGFCGIVVEPSGRAVIYQRDLCPAWCDSDWTTCGAAEEFLGGVLAAGCSAEKAIKLAIKYHDDAAGSVVTLTLDSAIEGEVLDPEEPEIAVLEPQEPEQRYEQRAFLTERGLGGAV